VDSLDGSWSVTQLQCGSRLCCLSIGTIETVCCDKKSFFNFCGRPLLSLFPVCPKIDVFLEGLNSLKVHTLYISSVSLWIFCPFIFYFYVSFRTIVFVSVCKPSRSLHVPGVRLVQQLCSVQLSWWSINFSITESRCVLFSWFFFTFSPDAISRLSPSLNGNGVGAVSFYKLTISIVVPRPFWSETNHKMNKSQIFRRGFKSQFLY